MELRERLKRKIMGGLVHADLVVLEDFNVAQELISFQDGEFGT